MLEYMRLVLSFSIKHSFWGEASHFGKEFCHWSDPGIVPTPDLRGGQGGHWITGALALIENRVDRMGRSQGDCSLGVKSLRWLGGVAFGWDGRIWILGIGGHFIQSTNKTHRLQCNAMFEVVWSFRNKSSEL